MNAWGVKNVRELIIESKKRGYTGFCLDTFHMRAKSINKVDLNPWQKNIKPLLSFTKEIHLAVGREDIIQSKIDTKQELKDLIENNKKGEIFKIISEIKKNKWKGPIIVEAPAKAIFNLDKSKRPDVAYLIGNHKKIIKNLKNLFQ